MALRQSRAVSNAIPSLVRYYASSDVPVKQPPPGTMAKPTPEPSVGKIHYPIGGQYKSQGTSVARTIRNIWKAGLKRAFWQIKEMNDTKATPITLIWANCRWVPWLGRTVWEISIMRIWVNYLSGRDGSSMLSHTNMILHRLNLDGMFPSNGGG